MSNTPVETLTLTRPDDWHVHLRDGVFLDRTVTDISRYFGRAIIMPNLVPPVTNVALAQEYRQRIQQNLGEQSRFTPLMTLYLTDNTSKDDIIAAKQSGIVSAAKLYPAGATTNSASGVTNIKNLYPVFEAMQAVDLPLLLHGEVTDADIDIFDREKVYIDRTLTGLVKDFPELKIVLEHITTADAASFVKESTANIAATITAHHLLFNRNHMLVGNIRPHFYCLPILKRNIHQHALIDAATSGSNKFFLGTDSAPHVKENKETACGCAGSYTAHAAIELYAEAFEAAGALDKLEGFASFNGPDFYGMARNSDTITLQKKDWIGPQALDFGDSTVVPVRAGESMGWQVV
ncbi:MAG: dihydroorotase [Algicola sp.]|nr:dihydroorotase [Algicola sp.]